MAKTKRLVLFSQAEKFALYGFPDFNDEHRREYFSFSESEMALINASIYSHLKIHCALQIGYFKAKNVFFQIDWRDVSCEDLQFVIYHYFPNDDIPKIAVTKHEYYTQRKRIADFFSYKLWSKAFAPILLKQAIQIIKRDTTANFIALELIAFLKDIKVIRPGYTTLQDIVSQSLANERIRIRDILNIELNPELRLNLNDLMVNEDNISKLAALKQDAKNFGFKMMSKERQKYNILEPIYTTAKDIIKKLELSNQNIEYYASLINYYEAWGLKNLQHNQNYLYILCYIFKRFQQINDNLIEAFIYHANKITHNIKVKTEINFADERINSQTKKIGRLLLLYVDEKFKDSNLFSRVRRRAFKIMPKEDIESYGQKLLNKSRNKKEFFWQEVDKAHKGCKKHLRPLFMKLGFSSESAANLWVHSVDLLQKTFAANKRFSKVVLDECSNTILPKTVYSYLLENNTNGKNSINANRYEYWMYRQINKQISTGVLYVENSLSYRCFNHELVSMDKKEAILESLSIPWLRQPIEKQLNNLISQLQDLWLTFDNYLKQGTLTHLQYDRKKQRLYCRKVSANKDDKLQSDFYNQLPFCEIDTILRFVDENCNYLSVFKPLQPRYAKGEWADKDKLIAAILSQALNYGNYKMAQASDISYHALETTSQQRLRLSTLVAANNMISNAISKLKIFPYYSLDLKLLYSSVDGQKFELETPNIKARYSRKYLREGQGVAAYTILSNHIPLQCKLIGSHEHESYYVFDIWYNNTSEITPEVITGDMHIINKANFAIMHWFGVKLQPRFVSLNAQLKNLYCAHDTNQYTNYLIKPIGQIDIQTILEQTNSINQLVATLALKEITQANLVKKLCHLPPENKLRKAVFEFDKLVRSIYTLQYMIDAKLQANIHKSQNRIESYHQLRAAIAKVGGKKQLYGKTDIDIEISNQCGRLVANAIIYYNSFILSGLLEKYQPVNNKQILTILEKVSPVAWQHIHFLGHYTFQNKSHFINIKEILERIQLVKVY